MQLLSVNFIWILSFGLRPVILISIYSDISTCYSTLYLTQILGKLVNMSINKVMSRNYSIGLPWWLQWLRIRLPMQGTRVQALVREDPTCHRAPKPLCHNYWACALEPASHNYWALMPQLLSPHATTTEPTGLEPVLCNKRRHRNEKPTHRNEE